jgi:hypothetical protein
VIDRHRVCYRIMKSEASITRQLLQFMGYCNRHESPYALAVKGVQIEKGERTIDGKNNVDHTLTYNHKDSQSYLRPSLVFRAGHESSASKRHWLDYLGEQIRSMAADRSCG